MIWPFCVCVYVCVWNVNGRCTQLMEFTLRRFQVNEFNLESSKISVWKCKLFNHIYITWYGKSRTQMLRRKNFTNGTIAVLDDVTIKEKTIQVNGGLKSNNHHYQQQQQQQQTHWHIWNHTSVSPLFLALYLKSSSWLASVTHIHIYIYIINHRIRSHSCEM